MGESITLQEVAETGESGMFAHEDSFAHLEKAGLIEVARNVVDNEGRIAIRASAAGYEAVANSKPLEIIGATTVANEISKPVQFAIEKGVPVPVRPKFGGAGLRGSRYPFATIEVDESFFVPKPVKSLATLVFQQNKKNSEPVGEETRVNRNGVVVPKTKQIKRFIVRSVEGGSRIWRVL